MATLYIMVGLPFSGKSTLARTIAAHTNSALVSFDTVWEEEKNNLLPDMDKVEEWKYILQATHQKITQFLTQNKSVVYDDMNLQIEHRHVLRTIATKCSAQANVIYMKTSITEIKNRQQRNATSQSRHTVSAENFDTALSQLQAPTADENVLVFLPSDVPELWIEKYTQ